MIRSLHPDDSRWWMHRAFVYVGRMHPEKGILHILRAWMELAARHGDRCPPLWLVGGTPAEIDAVRATVVGRERLSAHESAGRVHWWGFLDEAGISTVLLRSLVLIAHSKYEPGGRVVLEAMSEGVPVIATPHGFAKELVRDWESGFLVNFGDEKELSRRLEHFALQPMLRNALGARAADAVRRALSSWRFIETHCEIYDSVAAGTPLTSRAELPAVPVARDCKLFAPTYPHDTTPPVDARVVAFVERALGAGVTEVRPDDGGHSAVWSVAACGNRWVVKWPRSFLQTRPLWDKSGREPLVVEAGARFATERFAGTFLGMAGITASDEDVRLLLRPWLAPSAEDWRELDGCIAFARALDRMASVRVMEAEWLQDWLACFPVDPGDVPEVEAGIARIMQSSGRPWSRRRVVSARLGWHRLSNLLATGALDLPDDVLSYAQRGMESFRELAQAEASLDIVLCHGDPDPEHFRVGEDGEIVLIDGEKLHLAFPGRDVAEVITTAASTRPTLDAEAAFLEEALARLAPGEELRQTVLAWAGLNALEGIARGHALDRHASVRAYIRTWSALQRLAGVRSDFSP